MDNARMIARQLRLAVIVGCLRSGEIMETDAIELLSGPLTPGDDSTIVDDSALLHDADGLEKIKMDEEGVIILTTKGGE